MKTSSFAHSTLSAWAYSLLAMFATLLWGLVCVFAATSILALVEHWDDAPGGGFFILMNGMWTFLSALVLGGILCTQIFRNAPVKRATVGALAGVFAASLIPTAIFLLMDGGEDAEHRLAYIGTATTLVVTIGVSLYLTYRSLIARTPASSS